MAAILVVIYSSYNCVTMSHVLPQHIFFIDVHVLF